jgi:hypothetical protein
MLPKHRSWKTLEIQGRRLDTAGFDHRRGSRGRGDPLPARALASSRAAGVPSMVDDPPWQICEHVAEVQALLDDHTNGGKHSAANVVAKAQFGRAFIKLRS